MMVLMLLTMRDALLARTPPGMVVLDLKMSEETTWSYSMSQLPTSMESFMTVEKDQRGAAFMSQKNTPMAGSISEHTNATRTGSIKAARHRRNGDLGRSQSQLEDPRNGRGETAE